MSAELSSLGIAQIVESVIVDYDLRDEDGDRTYTLRFESDEAVAIIRLSQTALGDIKKQIDDLLKEVKNHEHE